MDLGDFKIDPLAKAIALASDAHLHQLDKAGMAYILHPLRVMFSLKQKEEQVVAVLHDVVEDSDWTLDELKAEGFSEDVVAAVDSLTRRKGESYTRYIKRIFKNSLACRVKLEDLRDNADLSRIAYPTQVDVLRAMKYVKAMKQIRQFMGQFE